MTAAQRRGHLADWLFREAAGAPYSTTQIVDVSGIYDGLQGRYDKARVDLLRLRENGVVLMSSGRPARWEHVDA